MRRRNTRKRGRVLPSLCIAGLGYVFYGWHTPAIRSPELSPAETVALRFPEIADPAVPAAPSATPTAAVGVGDAGTLGDAQLALFSPQPMVPPASQPELQAPIAAAAPVAPLPNATAPVATPTHAAVAPPANEPRAAAAPRRHVAERPGYMLNDAQIASIKARLNLTPDQERMWPAVEAALRNIAYTHSQQARARNATAATQTAGIDPNAVQGLKSAAVPLIMSFNTEQKDEVRNIVHVMGLDQLAAEF